MSKEVKRYCLSEFAEPHTYPIGPGAHVLAIDYEALEAERDALLAERDAMRSVLRDARQVIATALRASAPDWFETDEDVATHTTIKKIDAALQGEQP